MLFAGSESGGRKSWPWMCMPSAAERMTCCGTTREAAGKFGGDGIRSEVANIAVADLGWRRGPGFRASEWSMTTALPSLGFEGRPLEAVAWREACQILAENGDAPEMTTIDIVLVGGEQDGLAVGWRARRVRSRIRRWCLTAQARRRGWRWNRGASSRCVPREKQCDRPRPRTTDCRRPWRGRRCRGLRRRAKARGHFRNRRRRDEWTRVARRCAGVRRKCGVVVAAMRIKAICFPSGDQTGLESWSTLGSR